VECAYKFRIYPNEEQINLFNRTFGCVRFVYNHYLAMRKDVYDRTGKVLNFYDFAKDLPQLKKTYTWLQEVDSCALQEAVHDLDNAYKGIYRRAKSGKKPGRLHFRSKRNTRQSFRSACHGKTIRIEGDAVRLPKIGFMKCSISKEVRGRILTATVSRNPSGKYFIAIICTDVEKEPLPKTGRSTEIDIQSESFAEAMNHKRFSEEQKRLRRLHKRVLRKQRGGKNREKARVKFARLYEKIRNQRYDVIHKLSKQVLAEYDVITVSGLPGKSKAKHHMSIRDVAWGEFKRQANYKSKWYGKQLMAG
jgi:putative transposase